MYTLFNLFVATVASSIYCLAKLLAIENEATSH